MPTCMVCMIPPRPFNQHFSHLLQCDACWPFADVDGTLIQSIGDNANFLHKQAFAHGFKEVFGIDTTIDVRASTSSIIAERMGVGGVACGWCMPCVVHEHPDSGDSLIPILSIMNLMKALVLIVAPHGFRKNIADIVHPAFIPCLFILSTK